MGEVCASGVLFLYPLSLCRSSAGLVVVRRLLGTYRRMVQPFATGRSLGDHSILMCFGVLDKFLFCFVEVVFLSPWCFVRGFYFWCSVI